MTATLACISLLLTIGMIFSLFMMMAAYNKANRLQGMMSDTGRHPMSARKHNEWIVIAVSPESLKNAIEAMALDEHSGITGGEPLWVSDINAFSDDFIAALNAESEDGRTIVTKAFDEAIRLSIENGAQGVEL